MKRGNRIFNLDQLMLTQNIVEGVKPFFEVKCKVIGDFLDTKLTQRTQELVHRIHSNNAITKFCLRDGHFEPPATKVSVRLLNF
jgi:hypothetical protein